MSITATDMRGTVLRRFQQLVVANGVQILGRCLEELQAVSGPAGATARRSIISDTGAILIEAPTGSGKTLMAGNIVQDLNRSLLDADIQPTIWFWFAPFSGVIEQTARTMQAEFASLQVRTMGSGRNAETLEAGDVFVGTWQSVAVNNTESRKVRKSTELQLSVDDMITAARAKGFAIGAVIDEAHHSFRKGSQAFDFYTNILDPDLTILVTATPKDHDVDNFAKVVGINNLRRITVSRQDTVDERLTKSSVRSFVFQAGSDVQHLIDFKHTALKMAVQVHNRLRDRLAAEGHAITPLLLVQVDDSADAVDEAQNWLLEEGFAKSGVERLVRSHTAAEPDPHLADIAHDEQVEALIFKLAVATGFDAPRAFTLVSFRRNRDTDFGVQIVGRIMRVDRRLQSVENLPIELNTGYVFLAVSDAQAGLTSAADRINAVQTELASVSSHTYLVEVSATPVDETKEAGNRVTLIDATGASVGTVSVAPDSSGDRGQSGPSAPSSTDRDESPMTPPGLAENAATRSHQEQTEADLLVSGGPQQGQGANTEWQVYKLREDLHFPRRFERAEYSMESEHVLADVVDAFDFTPELLMTSLKSSATILQKQIDVFSGQAERPEEINGLLADKEIGQRAQKVLFKADEMDVLNPADLRAGLLQAFKVEVRRAGLTGFSTENGFDLALNKILALRPKALKAAISKAVAKNLVVRPTADLPPSVTFPKRLDPSRFNIYGIYPDDLNKWERKFAEELDEDLDGVVKWWHRNVPRRPESVRLPIPGLSNFYPDFLVGITDRRTEHGILLVETKFAINDPLNNAAVKAQALHPTYGKAMMLYLDEVAAEWKIVEYDDLSEKNYFDRAFRKSLLRGY